MASHLKENVEAIELGVKLNRDIDSEHSNQVFKKTVDKYNRRMFAHCTSTCLRDFRTGDLLPAEVSCLEGCFVVYPQAKSVMVGHLLDFMDDRV